MFLIYFISYGCNDSALVFLGGAEASASPSFALPMFITIKKIIILHLFLGVPAATVGGTGTPWHTRGYAPGTDSMSSQVALPLRYQEEHAGWFLTRNYWFYINTMAKFQFMNITQAVLTSCGGHPIAQAHFLNINDTTLTF